jgi:hypothetical protein
VNDLHQLRGPYPGLGAALTAFGVEQGTFLAYHASSATGPTGDPWAKVDQALRNPSSLPADLAPNITKLVQQTWHDINARKPERVALLKLLSRFELTIDQAKVFYVQEEREKAGVILSDAELLANPYLIAEKSRFGLTRELQVKDDEGRPKKKTIFVAAVAINTIDLGVFPQANLAKHFPVPTPSKPDGADDARRIRAHAISLLETAADEGHTLLPRDQVSLDIRALDIEPRCEVNRDSLDVIENSFANEISLATLKGGAKAYQLQRLADVGSKIRTEVQVRCKGRRHKSATDWQARVDQEFGKVDPNDKDEIKARAEKASALKELAEARFSVLIGSAGTGKTSLVSILCKDAAI